MKNILSKVRMFSARNKIVLMSLVIMLVSFIITTNGQENASREHSYDRIKSQICRQQEKYGWEVIFLVTNIDAIAEAKRFGIHADRAANYHARGIPAEGIKKKYGGHDDIFMILYYNTLILIQEMIA